MVESMPFSLLQQPPSLAKALIQTSELSPRDQSDTLGDARVLKTAIKGPCPGLSIT